MALTIPDLCLVVLIGPSGAGKSSFAAKHFRPTETISSDFCRGLVADDENDQAATGDAFDVLHHIVGKRLVPGRLDGMDPGCTIACNAASRPATAVEPEEQVRGGPAGRH